MVSSSSLLALVSSCYVASATLRGGAPPTASGAAYAAEVARQSMPPGVPDVVTVEQGMLQGVRATSSNLRYWLGVPYADTTAGSNAFRAPQPRPPWSGTRDASQWGPGCMQPHHGPDSPKNQSMDCLQANIYAPILPAGSSAAVMVFIHGGAWLEGSNQGPFYIYAGSYLAANESVVVVAINYRLSAWGFAALGPGSTEPVTGNFGLRDQIMALQWVQRNIGVFGGDPTRVTVFGESAGGMSIGILLGSPAAKGLFQAAIMESNVGGFNYKNQSEFAIYGDTFCQNMAPCNLTTDGSSCNVTCLRQAASSNPQKVMDAWSSAIGNVGDFIITELGHILDGLLGTGPVIDKEIMPAEPQSIIAGGQSWSAQAKIPVLLGSNLAEGQTFIYDGVPELPNFLAEIAYLGIFNFNETLASLINAQPRYHDANYTDACEPLSYVVTDYWFRCADELWARAAHAAGAAAYTYRWAHVYSNSSIFPTFGLPEICATMPCHASELPFVFHQVPDFTSFTPAEDVLSASMARYWGNFAKTGNPNGGNPVQWPQWDPVARSGLLLNDTISVESSLDVCGWWDSVAKGYMF